MPVSLAKHLESLDRRSMAKQQSKKVVVTTRKRDSEETASLSVTGGSVSSSCCSSPRTPPRSFLKHAVSQLSVFMDSISVSPSTNETLPAEEGLLGGSTASITSSFDIADTQLTHFEMEMKAMSLLSEVRKMLRCHKGNKKRLQDAMQRHFDLARARSNGVGALISIKKAKRYQENLRKVVAVIGYLETHELDLMADIEEARNALDDNEDSSWPQYEDFKVEVDIILKEKEPVWSDDELRLELEHLRTSY